MSDDPTASPLAPTPPVGFDPSSAKAIVGTVTGLAVFLITGFSALVTLLKGHDLIAVVQWIQGTQGVGFISALGAVATFAWRVTASVRKHLKALIAARAAPNDKAFVKGEGEPATGPVDAAATAARLKAGEPL